MRQQHPVDSVPLSLGKESVVVSKIHTPTHKHTMHSLGKKLAVWLLLLDNCF